MKVDKLVKLCMMLAMLTIVFGVCASGGYGQETSTTDDTIAAPQENPFGDQTDTAFAQI
jgi:hypothetical protein